MAERKEGGRRKEAFYTEISKGAAGVQISEEVSDLRAVAEQQGPPFPDGIDDLGDCETEALKPLKPEDQLSKEHSRCF